MSLNKIKKIWPVLVIVAIGFSVYFFNLHNGLFWDDDDWIINNVYVHEITWDNVKFWFTNNTLAGIGLKSNYYRPFLFFTFAVNYAISDIQPFFWHLMSNLIHVANGILVFGILYLVSRKKMVAFLTALIFTIHPLQTEAVTYISGRGDLLVTFFMLLALWFFIKSHLFSTSQVDRKVERIWIWRGLSLLSLVLALLSRETAIIFPLLLIVFYASFISQTKFLRSLWAGFIKAIPYLAIVLVYGVLRLTVLNFLNTLNFYTVPNVYADSLYVRMLTFLKVLLVYLKLLFVPVDLHMERGIDPALSFWSWPVPAVFLGLVGLATWLVYLYKKQKNQPTNSQVNLPVTSYQLPVTDFRVWLFGVGWFFTAMAPVSGITPINALLYEHWLYLPMIGFWFIAAFYLVKLFNYFKSKSLNTYFLILATILAVYFSFFGYQSIQRNILWGKPIDFYSDILKYEPDSVRINNNLGNLYYNQGDTDKAQEFYQKAVDSEDAFPQPHYNLGSILQSKGDIFGAVQEYEKAITLDPNFHFPYMNLVGIYAGQGDIAKASQYVTKLDELKPNDPRILYNAALIYTAEGNFELALQKAEQGLAHAGADPEVKKALEELIAKFIK